MEDTSRSWPGEPGQWDQIGGGSSTLPAILVVEDGPDMRVHYRLEGDEPQRRRLGATPRAGSKGDMGGRIPDCPGPVELILYVSAQSPRSFAAVENVKKILERFHSSRVRLTICDLAVTPEGGATDSLAFTPALVRRTPGPRTFILGHITNPEILLELLEDCEES
jgi:circadian clock protein KaiB